MNENDIPIIWYIDEDSRDLSLYQALLEKSLPENANLQVKAIKAFPHLEDYLDILNEPNTVCIIVDQRLKEEGTVDHTGIELAAYLRRLNEKIPIYILTSYADEREEFENGEWNVEDVISKEVIGDKKRRRVFVTRLLRHLSEYETIRDEKGKRFRELVKKSINEDLTEAEGQELRELDLERLSGILAKERIQAEQVSDYLDKTLQEIQNLKNLLLENKRDSRDG